ncbi:hypothetical protein [Bowmanella pacifica]|uniref:hypothetical protein n=1 Tax=Bowmanella pacifica TaxID=502051 RepID=UPI003571685C
MKIERAQNILMSALNFKVKMMKAFCVRILGYGLFLPFLFFYSYILGPVLKAVLLPGGLMLLFLIQGWKDGVIPFLACMKKNTSPTNTVVQTKR